MSNQRAGWMVAAVVLAGIGRTDPASAQSTRQLFVGVFNEANEPLTDVAPGEFTLTENDAPRRITRASLATDPMRIVLLVDNGDSAQQIITHIRDGLHAFLDGLQPEHEVVLITTGRQLRVREGASTDRERLQKAVDNIFADKGAATVLLDSLRESWNRFLKNERERWPVFVIVTTDGAEGSNATQQQQYDAFMNQVRESGASVHAVAMQLRGGSLASQVSLNLTQNTGGEYLPIAASTGLSRALGTIARRLSDDYDYIRTRYVIRYETRAKTGENTQIGLSVGRDDVKLQMAPDRRSK